MTPEDAEQLRQRLMRSLEEAAGLPAQDVEAIEVLIDAGEWEVALEALCAQLYEYGVKLGAQQQERLKELGRDLRGAVPRGLCEPSLSWNGGDES